MKKLLVLLTILGMFFIGCKNTEIENPMGPDLDNPSIYPVIERFVANPDKISQGNYSTLNWTTSNTTRVKIEPEIGETTMSGSIEVAPENSIVYTLTAYNGQEQKAKAVEIIVYEKYNSIEVLVCEPVPGSTTNEVEFTIEYFVGDSHGYIEDGYGVNLFTHPTLSTGGCPDYFDCEWLHISELGTGQTKLTIKYVGSLDQFTTHLIVFGIQPAGGGGSTFYSKSINAIYIWRK